MGAERTSEIFQEDEKNNDAAGGMTDVILERTVWHKIDRWILPVITIFYLLSFLVRATHFSLVSSFILLFRTVSISGMLVYTVYKRT
jgi:hypothetical protein